LAHLRFTTRLDRDRIDDDQVTVEARTMSQISSVISMRGRRSLQPPVWA